MKKAFMVSMDMILHEKGIKKAKISNLTFSELISNLLNKSLEGIDLETIKKEMINKGCEQQHKEIIDFKKNIQRQFLKWQKDGLGDNYINDTIDWLEFKKKRFNQISTNKKQKEEMNYWIDKQILLIQAKNWDNLDTNRELNTGRLIYHLLKKKGLEGKKLKLIMDIINGNREVKIKTEETLCVGDD